MARRRTIGAGSWTVSSRFSEDIFWKLGAGVGSFSDMLLRENPQSLIILEPSTNLWPLIRDRVAVLDQAGIAEVR